MVKRKKGVSAIIGYILLVTMGIVMAVIVFNYLKTYVPKDLMSCPDGASMFLKDYSYDRDINQLNITLKNNGKFNLAGFVIHGANNTEQAIATIDLSQSLDNSTGKLFGNFIVTSVEQGNLIHPNWEREFQFNNLPTDFLVIDIIPMRFQEENNRIKPVSCTSAKIREELI